MLAEFEIKIPERHDEEAEITEKQKGFLTTCFKP